MSADSEVFFLPLLLQQSNCAVMCISLLSIPMRFTALLLLCSFGSYTHALSNLLSRDNFLLSGVLGAVGTRIFSGTTRSTSTVILPLLFLLKGGCLALPIVLDEAFRYYAIVDTGSPFLTAPDTALDYSKDASRQYPVTEEQYGESIGGMQWRRSHVRVGDTTTSISNNMLLGVPPSNVLADTGGIFCGLMPQDDARPTVLQQWGYASFVLDYRERQLLLSKSNLFSEDDPTTLPIYDLTRYGPNLHHFAIECHGVTLQTPKGEIQLDALERPVVVVLDSGLTGCIFSDSWLEDLPVSVNDIQGAQLQVGSTTLTSRSEYWHLSCFRLPWFTSEDHHPHIIAAGATFLNDMKLTVDSRTRRLQLS
jgi:hypothetical protein